MVEQDIYEKKKKSHTLKTVVQKDENNEEELDEHNDSKFNYACEETWKVYEQKT